MWKRFEKLDIHIPDSRNTQFDKTDVLRMVLKMSQSKKKFSRSAAKRLKAEAFRQEQGGGKKRRAASSDWGMGRLAEMDPEHTKRWCDNTVRFMARGALASDMIRRNTMVGIDLTLVPYYGRHLRDDMLKSKPLKGTKYFDAHMTTHSIGPGYEIPLSDTRMTRDDKVDIILHESLKKIQRAGLRPQLYLADRGFFSVACMRVLGNTGRDFLMPAVKNARVKEAIERHHRGEIGAASRFAMKSAEFGAVSFNLLIVKKDGCKASDPVAEQYVAFATSLPCRTKEDLVGTIPETYRGRWIIETAFRVIKDVKGKTCSRSLHVRIFLFHFALLLYFLWKCTKHTDMLQGFLAGGDDFTIAEFLDSVSSLTKAILLWEKNHGNFVEQ